MCLICESKDNLGSIQHLKTLDCIGCKNITEFPELPFLEELYCCNCSLIKEISNLASLEFLDCKNCIKLEKISLLPKLKTLDCSHCKNLTCVEFCPEIAKLSCGLTSFTEIPKLENLKELYCGFTNIKKISGFKTLRILSCINNKKLEYISDCPNLEDFVCWNCLVLKKIPKSPLTWLMLSQNDLIEKIEYKSLRNLVCFRCENLQKINAENVVDFKSVSCKKLMLVNVDSKCRQTIIDTPWLSSQTIKKIIKLQRFFRNCISYFRLKRWLETDVFRTLYYEPPNGIKYKKALRHFEKTRIIRLK